MFVNKGRSSHRRQIPLLGGRDSTGGLLVVVDDDTDTGSGGSELDLGALLEGGLGVRQGAVEAVLALHQVAALFLPGLDLGNVLIVLLILSLLAGVELLSYAWNGERRLLVGENKIISYWLKGTQRTKRTGPYRLVDDRGLLDTLAGGGGGGRDSLTLGDGSVGSGSGSLEGVDETLGACGAVSGERNLTITDHQGGRVSAQVDVKRGRAGRGGEDGDKAVLHFGFFGFLL